MPDLNEISAQEIGRRLRLVRDEVGVKQESAARVIGVSRPTLVAIEKGARRVRIQELQRLAQHYGTSANALLRREAVYTDLVPRFRKLQETDDRHALEAIRLLGELVRAEVELENVLGIGRSLDYPPERGINEGEPNTLAEQHAQELRSLLEIGEGPIADIFALIESDLGIRLYQRRLSPNSTVAGLFAYDDTVGACILLNANHPLERRVQSAAHELGHFVGTRQVPEVLDDNDRFLSRPERYANKFGRVFLTPGDEFGARFRKLTAGAEKLTRRHVLVLAHQYCISREACVRRLEELDLVPKGSWEYFVSNGGITDKHAREIFGTGTARPDTIKEDANRPVAFRLSQMAHRAWKRDLMSEGQLADLLKLHRFDLRQLIDQVELEECNTDDILRLSG